MKQLKLILLISIIMSIISCSKRDILPGDTVEYQGSKYIVTDVEYGIPPELNDKTAINHEGYYYQIVDIDGNTKWISEASYTLDVEQTPINTEDTLTDFEINRSVQKTENIEEDFNNSYQYGENDL